MRGFGLNCKSDRRTLIVLFFITGVLFFTLDTRSPDLVQVFIYFGLNAWLAFIAHVINHNSGHSPVFKGRHANQLLSYVITFLIGIPASAIAASHIHNHHVHNNNNDDWMSSKVLGNRKGIRRLYLYLVHVFNLPRLKNRPEAQKLPASLFLRIKREQYFLIASVLVLLLFFTWKTMVFYVLARLTGMSVLFLINLVQHDHLDDQPVHNRCRNFVGPLVNIFLFNNGYHSAHHINPGAHWSELSKKHRDEVVGTIDPNLNCPSLIAHLWQDYILYDFKKN